MPVYTYKAIDLDAAEVSGELAADTPRQARDELRARGLTIRQVRPRPQRARAGFWQRRRARRHSRRIVAFTRDLSTLLGAGIPLIESIDTLIGPRSGPLKEVLLALREDVASGAGLAEAMERAQPYFDELSVSVTRVGESTGTLEVALERLADFKEHGLQLRGRIATALMYPAMVSLVGLCVMIFLMTYVVPDLLAPLQESGRPLPMVTRLVKGASDFLLDWGLLVLAAGAGLAAALALAVRTRRGRRLWHWALLRIPLVGELAAKETIARLAIVLASLLRSGVLFLQALGIAARTVPNVVFQEALKRCEDAIAAGQEISAPLARTKVFPPMVVQMMTVGQQSGEIEPMLERLATAYERQVETATARLTAVLEPALIILLAVMVGTIAFAIVLPILEASNVL